MKEMENYIMQREEDRKWAEAQRIRAAELRMEVTKKEGAGFEA